MGDRTHQTNEAPAQEELNQQQLQQEEPTRQRFEGANETNIPPVSAAPVEDDKRVRELKTKVNALVNQRFHGDMKAAFDHYGRDGEVDSGELRRLLEDAGVGNGLTRGLWVKGVMERIDSNLDGRITWQEFQVQLHAERD